MAAPKGNKNHWKHGGGGTRLYNIWKTMRQRCNNPNNHNYNNYGGRGITICPEWNHFSNFRAWAVQNGYSDSLSIDRINVNGIYEPSNCRWIDYIGQANNKTSNRMVEVDGQMITVAQLCRQKGLKYKLVIGRLEKGKTLDEALGNMV